MCHAPVNTTQIYIPLLYPCNYSNCSGWFQSTDDLQGINKDVTHTDQPQHYGHNGIFCRNSIEWNLW